MAVFRGSPLAGITESLFSGAVVSLLGYLTWNTDKANSYETMYNIATLAVFAAVGLGYLPGTVAGVLFFRVLTVSYIILYKVYQANPGNDGWMAVLKEAFKAWSDGEATYTTALGLRLDTLLMAAALGFVAYATLESFS